MKIKEYRTAAGDSLKSLDLSVNRLIADGFQPFGNPYVTGTIEGRIEDFFVCQAMVKNDSFPAGSSKTSLLAKVASLSGEK
jgi:hypothetical protein